VRVFVFLGAGYENVSRLRPEEGVLDECRVEGTAVHEVEFERLGDELWFVGRRRLA